ncbi:MAG: thioesterase family protein [Moraxellaceae bacterium]|nr:thioesterase family protein [Moraxellaceae bacterium]
MLDELLQHATTADSVVIPEGWGQGRATYGGLVAALLCQRLLGAVGEGRVLRSATVSFVGPVATGPAELSVEIFRSGKSVTQAEARLRQNGEVLAVLLASFGATRASGIVVAPAAAPALKPVEEAQAFPYIPGVVPDFIRHIDMRLAAGGMPFTGAEQPDFAGWMRYREAPAKFSLVHLFGLIDCWPPSVLPMLKTLAPASSLCWTLEFLQFPETATGESWWQYAVQTDASAEGYVHTEAKIHDDSGRLVAISRQTITVFA